MSIINARTKEPFIIILDEWDCLFREGFFDPPFRTLAFAALHPPAWPYRLALLIQAAAFLQWSPAAPMHSLAKSRWWNNLLPQGILGSQAHTLSGSSNTGVHTLQNPLHPGAAAPGLFIHTPQIPSASDRPQYARLSPLCGWWHSAPGGSGYCNGTTAAYTRCRTASHPSMPALCPSSSHPTFQPHMSA